MAGIALQNFVYGWVYNSDNYRDAIVAMYVSLKSPEIYAGMHGFAVHVFVLYIHCSWGLEQWLNYKGIIHILQVSSWRDSIVYTAFVKVHWKVSLIIFTAHKITHILYTATLKARYMAYPYPWLAQMHLISHWLEWCPLGLVEVKCYELRSNVKDIVSVRLSVLT
jgi:hypothetical protein